VIKRGDIIRFGAYDWRVLDARDNMALILSDKVLEQRPYDKSKSEKYTWAECEMRTYLNGAFCDAFSLRDKGRIAETRVTTNDNPLFGTEGGAETNDRVFLLSLEEVVEYFGDSGQLDADVAYYKHHKRDAEDETGYVITDRYNDARKADDLAGKRQGMFQGWWLRSPGYIYYSMATVTGYGDINVIGYHVDETEVGVRPAMWVNLE
jgi:hypothetical protein